MPDALELLLPRSVELHGAIAEALDGATIAENPRFLMAASLATTAIEHGASVVQLLSTSHVSSALALARVQLDATVRGLWILYAASGSKVDGFLQAVAAGRLDEVNNLPTFSEMIDSISQKGPPGLGDSLQFYRTGVWRPLSSIVHGGVVALQIRLRDIPESWATDSLRNSNGLSVVAAMTIAVTGTGDEARNAVQRIQRNFLDCSPSALDS